MALPGEGAFARYIDSLDLGAAEREIREMMGRQVYDNPALHAAAHAAAIEDASWPTPAAKTRTRLAIEDECTAVSDMLVAKNEAYGNSALEPVRIFSRAESVEQLKVRIDDKLSRLARGDGSGDEDAELDLIGYLILLRVARRLA